MRKGKALEQITNQLDNQKTRNVARENKLNILAFIIIIELVLGGAGRLFVIGPITIRYVLFMLAISYFFIKIILNNFKTEKNIFYPPVIFFLFFYLISIMNGIVKGYPLSDIIFSSKGYLYILMLFPFTLFVNKTEKARAIFNIFNRAAVVLAIFSISIFLIFRALPSLYGVINPILLNLKYGHLSIRYGLPSVFFKTSPYMAIAFINEMFQYVHVIKKRNSRTLLRMLILFLGCLTTMTMGIWVAVIVGIIIIILLSKGNKKLLAILTTLTIGAIIIFIFSDFVSLALSSRLSRADSSYIIKIDQLYTMLNIWLDNFLFGKGFGINVLFINEIATRKMVKFELFWMELLVNMGLMGFIAYVYIVIKTMFIGFKISKHVSFNDSVHIKSLITGLVMLCIISSVNPFLNNPIGLGYLIIVMSSINIFYKKELFLRE